MLVASVNTPEAYGGKRSREGPEASCELNLHLSDHFESPDAACRLYHHNLRQLTWWLGLGPQETHGDDHRILVCLLEESISTRQMSVREYPIASARKKHLLCTV